MTTTTGRPFTLHADDGPLSLYDAPLPDESTPAALTERALRIERLAGGLQAMAEEASELGLTATEWRLFETICFVRQALVIVLTNVKETPR